MKFQPGSINLECEIDARFTLDDFKNFTAMEINNSEIGSLTFIIDNYNNYNNSEATQAARYE